jgi:MYXO-CTERM domain-containing protein
VATGERYLAALAGVLGLVFLRDAQAYCQATTCDPLKEQCREEGGCVVEGAPLHWNSRCLSFGAQNAGSPLRHITYQELDVAVLNAFKQWMNADCGGGTHPSFQTWDLGAPFGGITCDTPEFNSLKPNANVVMFRDDGWAREEAEFTLAATNTKFDSETGALLDADIEINSFGQEELTTTSVASEVGKDLQAILTHEVGHFLGLAHSNVEKATMYRSYLPGDLNYRSLHPDDEKGICAIYPPDRDAPACVAPTPPHGFTRYCGGDDQDGTSSVSGCACSTAGRARPSSFAGAFAMAAAVGLAGRRKRRVRISRPDSEGGR